MTPQTLALVGAVGGAGTTRTAVEFGATLARDGHEVVILDAAFATQGLAEYVEGRIDPDMTAVVADDASLEASLAPLATGLAGGLEAAPARAPFERVARAKTAGAANRFERQVTAAARGRDVVIVDTPPVAANQAVAALHACETVALVAPATRRGADGVARMTGVLEDLGTSADATVATFDDDAEHLPAAAGRLPTSAVVEAEYCPTALRDGGVLARPVATAVEAVLDVDLAVEFDETSGLDAYLPG